MISLYNFSYIKCLDDVKLWKTVQNITVKKRIATFLRAVAASIDIA